MDKKLENLLVEILRQILKSYIDDKTNNQPNCNGYIGINTNCEYCKNKKGTHKHFLNLNTQDQYKNMDDTGTMCNYCMKNPGIPHYHDDCY